MAPSSHFALERMNAAEASTYPGDGGYDYGLDTEASTETWKSILLHQPPPDSLPEGWILHRSRSQQGYVYYWNQYTGECTWEPPFHVTGLAGMPSFSARTQAAALSGIVAETLHSLQQQQQQQFFQEMEEPQMMENAQNNEDIIPAVKSIMKKNPSMVPVDTTAAVTAAAGIHHSSDFVDDSTDLNMLELDKKLPTVEQVEETIRIPDMKKQKLDSTTTTSIPPSSTAASPEQVHVLHILKKHKDSRRPSSWRIPKITISKEKAREELQELLSIIYESLTPIVETNQQGEGSSSSPRYDPQELRATFEELAKTESDCSSAKKGGDLGWFGRKKMQPAFEEASFTLKVGELSDIVDTSSGLHILLRLG